MKIIIIGAGPGGYETAVEAAKRDIEVVLIERGEVGGTCLNEGCIPTKTLCRSAALLSDVKRAGEFGISLGGASAQDPASGQEGRPVADFAKVQERKNAVVAQLRSGVESLLRGPRITLVHGSAQITGPHTVKVTGPHTVKVTGPAESDAAECPDSEDGVCTKGDESLENGEKGALTQEYTADHIIIATGSHSASLPIPGADLPGVLNSTQMLRIDHVPQRLCIIGAGVIGLEFACIFNSFGSSVTVLEYCPQILPNFDADLAKRLKQSLSKSGVSIITKAAVQRVSRADSIAGESDGGNGHGALKVEYALKDVPMSVEADTVLMAVGRRPNVEGLGLESVGVQYSARGIVVDDFMRTSVPSIHAIGDVNGRCMLAHAATYQGLKALNNICYFPDRIDLSLVPAVVFTSPEAASVGLTEQQCTERGIDFTSLKSFFRANGKAVSQGETDGFIKVLVATEGSDFTPGQILGCHMFGPHASDLIAEMTALIHCRATILDLKSIIHAHPTLAEAFHNLA